MEVLKRSSRALNPVGLVKSKTTQNIAGAGGSIAGAVAFIRANFPTLIPWGVELDGSIILVGTVVLSRVVAFVRDRSKAKRGLEAMLAPLLVVCLALGGLTGCVTVQAPDGTITVRPDIEAIQLALIQAETALDIWQNLKDSYAGDDDSADEWERELAERQQRVQEVLLLIEQFKDALEEGGLSAK